jgi:hypothetical protein
MTRPAKSKKKDTTKARLAKGSDVMIPAKTTAAAAAKGPLSSATGTKNTRPRPRPAYKGATSTTAQATALAVSADSDPSGYEDEFDKRIASAALMMLGRDKPDSEGRAKKANTDEDTEESMGEEEEDFMEEVEGDGVHVGIVGNLDTGTGSIEQEEPEDSEGNDDTVTVINTSCEYGSSYFIEQIVTLLFQLRSPANESQAHPVIAIQHLKLNLKCLAV